jgi:hypothetical protein
MCPIESTSADLFEVASLSSFDRININGSDDLTGASDIPEFVYIHPNPPLMSEPCTLEPGDFAKPSTLEQRLRDLPMMVSICNSDADELHANIPNHELQTMKRMIDDLKNTPDLIYKRLCIRYDESTIQRGNAKMNEVKARCGMIEAVEASACDADAATVR